MSQMVENSSPVEKSINTYRVHSLEYRGGKETIVCRYGRSMRIAYCRRLISSFFSVSSHSTPLALSRSLRFNESFDLDRDIATTTAFRITTLFEFEFY